MINLVFLFLFNGDIVMNRRVYWCENVKIVVNEMMYGQVVVAHGL